MRQHLDGYERGLRLRWLLLLMNLSVFDASVGLSNTLPSSLGTWLLTAWCIQFLDLAWTLMIGPERLPGAWLLKTQRSCRFPRTPGKTGSEFVGLLSHPQDTSFWLPTRRHLKSLSLVTSLSSYSEIISLRKWPFRGGTYTRRMRG